MPFLPSAVSRLWRLSQEMAVLLVKVPLVSTLASWVLGWRTVIIFSKVVRCFLAQRLGQCPCSCCLLWSSGGGAEELRMPPPHRLHAETGDSVLGWNTWCRQWALMKPETLEVPEKDTERPGAVFICKSLVLFWVSKVVQRVLFGDQKRHVKKRKTTSVDLLPKPCYLFQCSVMSEITAV